MQHLHRDVAMPNEVMTSSPRHARDEHRLDTVALGDHATDEHRGIVGVRRLRVLERRRGRRGHVGILAAHKGSFRPRAR